MQGAEALVTLHKGTIVKERVPKLYRLKIIDDMLRKRRTKREIKVLATLKGTIPVPQVLKSSNYRIVMEHLPGKMVADIADEHNAILLAEQIGSHIRKMHEAGIIHGDLTTSNMIFHDDTVYFIDFGLSFFSTKTEDKAVDLHVLHKAIRAKHHQLTDFFSRICKTYGDKDVLERLTIVEKRGRNK